MEIFEVIQYFGMISKIQVVKICDNVFVSDWFQLVINIHDYSWNLRQTKHFVMF